MEFIDCTSDNTSVITCYQYSLFADKYSCRIRRKHFNIRIFQHMARDKHVGIWTKSGWNKYWSRFRQKIAKVISAFLKLSSCFEKKSSPCCS